MLGTFTFRSVPLGKSFCNTASTIFDATFFAPEKSHFSYELRLIAIDGIPKNVPSVYSYATLGPYSL